MFEEKMAVSVKEMAKLLGVNLQTAYNLAKQDGFPAIHVSEKRIIIPVEGLKKWLAEAGERS